MSEKTAVEAHPVIPVLIEQGYLDGKGLIEGDPGEFEGEGIEAEDGGATPGFRTHVVHTGNILVSIYEAGPAKVRIDGSHYDEFVQVLMGRLILTPDGGEPTEYKVGDSLVVPKGFTGTWDMPERYRELIVVDTLFMQAEE